ncbi:MAG: choice-of-anchor J domain-containing protein [Prevotella sp.]|nr:choice-of-anchor J domain-containing protein [Prevotella sp.]
MRRNQILSICALCVMLLLSVSAVAQSGRVVPVRPVSLDQHDQWETMKKKSEEKTAVVRPMGYSLLTPVAKTADQMLPQPFKVQKRQASAIPMAAADYKMPAQIYGVIAYSNKWANGNGAGNFGVYTFTADNPASAKAVVKNDNFKATGGALYANGKLNVLNYTDLWGMVILDHDWYEYSTQYWDLLQHRYGEGDNAVTRLMSACGSYDEATGQFYAIMYTDDMQHQVFGTLDYAKNTRKIIKQLDESENVLAMAISPAGVVYAVRTDGMFVQIDKTSGKMTVIGDTGVKPTYLQSAAIDPRTGRMFWAACSAVDPVGLYEIDIESGKATLISKFANSEEYVGLYIPAPVAEEEAPAACTSLSTSFTGDALTGTVNFRLPSKTYAGESLGSETLGYCVYIDGELVAEGQGEAGTQVKPEVTVDKDAMYRFEVSAKNSVGEGPRIHLDKFIGKDAPVAPTNVKMAKTANENEIRLTWSAPTTGVNKGYVNKDNLNYTIVRYPDQVTVSEHQAERVFVETITSTALANYYYVVTAYNGDIEGLSAESNRMQFGEAIEPPYFDDLEDTAVGAKLFTIIDANKDGNTWQYGYWNGTQNADLYYTRNEDRKTPADDWVITSPIHMKESRFYRLTFDVNNDYYFGGDEVISAWVGNDNTIAAMTTEVVPVTIVNNGDPMPLTGIIKSDKDSRSYVGFHCESPADQSMLELDNIRIEECGVFAAPDTVTNFTITPGSNGAQTAKLKFTVPTTNFLGEPIEKVDSIVIYRGKAKRKVFKDAELGAQLQFNDTSVPTGINTYYIYTYNSYGCGIPAERSAWIGTDIPNEPTDVKLVMTGLTAKLTWKAPTTGKHGGYVKASELTYNIEDMNAYIKGDHRAGTTYTENRGATQEILYYRVSAQSKAGGSDYVYSNTVISGAPYELPFKESFANAKTEQLWTAQQSDGFAGQMGYTNSISADADNGAAIIMPGKAGDVAQLTSGKISLKSAPYPILEFYYYAVPRQATALSIIIAPNGDAEQSKVLQTIDYTKISGDEGWRKVMLRLDEFTSTDHILLSFNAQATGARFGNIAFDAISVHNQSDNDLVMQKFSLPGIVSAGKTAKAVVTVSNQGRLSVSDYKVRLMKNGLFADEVSGKEIASGETMDYVFDIPTAITDKEENEFEATIIDDDDADQSNNKATAKMIIEMPLYPVPTAGEGVSDDDVVVLSWQAPDLTPREIKVTDDFERYDPFIIDGIGTWTVRDGDRDMTLGLQTGDGNTVMYDHVGEPMAYQVFNAEAAGLSAVTQLQAHSGSQMLSNIIEANKAADDWLISPELSGCEQTITFWVRAMGDNYAETFEVLASQEGTEPADFTVVEASGNVAGGEWTEISVLLPEGTRYFAIHVGVKQKFMLMIDDITYTLFNTADLKLLGYNIYWADELLNDEPITTTTYETIWLGSGDYRVTAVYEQGESALSEPFRIVTTGIENVTPDSSSMGEERIYDLSGRRIPNASKLPKGVFIRNGKRIVVK